MLKDKLIIDEEKMKSTLEVMLGSLLQRDEKEMAGLEKLFGQMNTKKILDTARNARLQHDFNISDYLTERYKADQKTQGILYELASGRLYTFLEKYIVENEGTTCSVDKASFVLSKIIESIKKSDAQSLKYYYKEGDFPEEPEDPYIGELAYWCPGTLEDTKEALELYFSYRRKTLFFHKKEVLTFQLVFE